MASSFTLVTCVMILTGIEVGATSALTHWARSEDGPSLVAGVSLFSCLGLFLGYSIKLVNHMNMVYATGQAMNIAGIAIVSCTVFRETMTHRHCVGVFLAIVSSLCFM